MHKLFMIAGLALAACTPAAPRAEDAAKAAAIMARADCATLERAGPENVFSATPCRLNPKGGDAATDRYILVDFASVGETDAEAPGAITATLVDAAGATLQTMEEKGLGLYLYPQMKDFDGDGALDMSITRDLGNANSVRAIWRLNPASGIYSRIGEVSSIFTTPMEGGEIAVINRSSAASLDVQVMRIVNEALQPVAAFTITAEVAEDGKLKRVTCELNAAPGVPNAEARLRDIEAEYCAKPALAKAFE